MSYVFFIPPPFLSSFFFFFFFNDTATTEIYTLSLHDALPILAYFCSSPGCRTRLPLQQSQAYWNSFRLWDRSWRSASLSASHWWPAMRTGPYLSDFGWSGAPFRIT